MGGDPHFGHGGGTKDYSLVYDRVAMVLMLGVCLDEERAEWDRRKSQLISERKVPGRRAEGTIQLKDFQSQIGEIRSYPSQFIMPLGKQPSRAKPRPEP